MVAKEPDPELLARLGLKRASDLEEPEAEPARLPWNTPDPDVPTDTTPEVGTGGRRPRLRDLAERNRAVADAAAEERSLAGEHRQRRVQRSKPLPKKPRPGHKGSGKQGSGKSGLVGGRATAPEPEPVPDWGGDVEAAPSWATDGSLPDRVAQLISTWEGQLERDDQDQRDREAAERIAAGEDVGPETTEPKQLEPLTNSEALRLADQVGLRLLSAQPRTRHELRQKMAERDVPLFAIEEKLDEFEKRRYLDDAAFAKAWVESRVRSKGFARGRLSMELRRKGIDQELIEDALAGIDSEDEKYRCEALALKKLGTRTLPPAGPSQEDRKERDKVLRRVVGFLARKGFNQGMAVSCARRAMERHDAGDR